MLKFRPTMVAAMLALGVSSVFAETITVTNTNDSGAGSLRQAIISANADQAATTILFNIPGATGAERIINVPTALPAFTFPVELRVDGAQQGVTVLKAPIINGPGAATTGLTFNGASAGSKVETITFRDFVFSIVLNTGNITINNNRFQNNIGGIDIRFIQPTGGNTIKGNTFTTTHTSAYAIAGVSGGGNTIQGNGFTGEGISMSGGGNIIGGPNNADPNTFTNVSGDAISISNASGAVIKRNTIHGSTGNGINVSGTDMTIESNNLSGNVGWDIIVDGGHSNRINLNQVTGANNGVFNGILLKNGISYTVNNNWVTAGSIELQSMSANSWYGQLRVTLNTIVNDPSGFSGHGAISLTDVTSAIVWGNYIHHNAGNGVHLLNSSYNKILSNQIYENGRTGVNAGSNLYNKISLNYIASNHADAGGGRTGISAFAKSAPVISSAKRVGYNFILTGSGTVANDTVEIFQSDAVSRNSTLAQNAFGHKLSIKATGTTWTATIPVGSLTGGDVYFIATSTDVNGTTSSFSRAVGVEINGPTQATTNHTSYYYAEFIPGATYQWWSTLPIYSMSVSGNVAQFNFSQVGSGTVSVGYTDPGTGAWKQYNLAVSVMGPARFGMMNESSVAAEVAPNPFANSTTIKLNAIAGDQAIDLNLFDMKGQLVYSSKGHKEGEEVEVGNNLEVGMYSLQLISGTEVKTIRIVKN